MFQLVRPYSLPAAPVALGSARVVFTYPSHSCCAAGVRYGVMKLNSMAVASYPLAIRRVYPGCRGELDSFTVGGHDVGRAVGGYGVDR